MRLSRSFLLIASLLIGTSALAAPVDVSYKVLGSAGNYTYDFSVTNNLGDTNNIYFFGVNVPNGNAVDANGYNSTVWLTWNNDIYGGSNTVYNQNWVTNNVFDDSIHPGDANSSFQVISNDLNKLTSVNWFAFAYGGEYFGPGNERPSTPWNPLFEGSAKVLSDSPIPSPVPEPEVYAMMLAGLGLVGFMSRRKKSV